jgi:hypothetical protein
MRVQTSFEKFSQATNGHLFAFCFVGLRVLLGLSAIYFVSLLPGLESQGLWDDRLWFDFIAPLILAAGGGALVLGLLVRPFTLAAMIVTLAFSFTFLDLQAEPYHALPMFGLVLLLGMFSSGGAGHVFGLDGIVYRNMRRAGPVIKFLFG